MTAHRAIAAAIITSFALGSAGNAGEPTPPPPFEVAHEAPLNAELKLLATARGFRQFRIEYNGIRGDRVPGFLYVPTGSRRPRPAVLLQYGIGGNKTTDYIVEIGRQFVAAGFVVLTIDAPLRGERKRKDAKKPLLGQFSRRLFAQYCGDYSRAIDFLLTRREVDRQRIGYVGISWGAITGVTFAANDPRIRAMASLVGGGNFAGLLSGWQNDESNGSLPSLDPVDHVARLADRPLLMINVTQDQLVPRPYAEALHRAAGRDTKIVWLDTDHYFSTINRTQVIADVINFMRRGLDG